MFLARVTGNVVASQKDRSLNGQKLFVVEPLNVKYDEATNKPASRSTSSGRGRGSSCWSCRAAAPA
jgi:microcompartment protein CcmK/EutM